MKFVEIDHSHRFQWQSMLQTKKSIRQSDLFSLIRPVLYRRRSHTRVLTVPRQIARKCHRALVMSWLGVNTFHLRPPLCRLQRLR